MRELTRKLPTHHPPAAQLGKSQAALSWGIIELQCLQAESTASQSPERPAVRDSDGATTRQIARRFGHYKARNSANARQACEGIGVTAAPHLAGVAFSAAAWPIRGAWWEGVRSRQKGRDAHKKRAPSVARWRLLGCWKGRKKRKERAMSRRDFYTPRKRRRGRARALPNAAVAVSWCRVAVWSFTRKE
jgi:hypothetical protein